MVPGFTTMWGVDRIHEAIATVADEIADAVADG